jgi:hypothetical protein
MANASGIDLSANVIIGQVLMNHNRANPATVLVPEDATIDLSANQVRGSLSCAGNRPPPINDGSGNTVSGARTGQCRAL